MQLRPLLPYLKPLYVGVTFFIFFCGYQTAQNFQSVNNKTLGFWSVALVYGFYAIGQFLMPIVVHLVSPKFSLFFAGVCYVTYLAVNVYIIDALYLVASAICGFGASLLWSGVTTLLSGYEQEVSRPSYVYTLFFVPMYFNFLGNVIPLIVGDSASPILFLVLTGVGAFATILFLFVPNSPPVEQPSTLVLLFATFKSFINPPQILFFPLALAFGIARSFYYSILPTLSSEMTSYIYISMGASMAVSTFCWGFLNSLITEQITLVIPVLMGILNVSLGIVVDAVGRDTLGGTTCDVLVVVIGAIAGISDSGLESIMSAFINKIYPKQVGPLCAWRVVGLVILVVSIAYANYIPAWVDLTIILLVQILAAISLLVIIVVFRWLYRPIMEKNSADVKASEKERLTDPENVSVDDAQHAEIDVVQDDGLSQDSLGTGAVVPSVEST